MLHNIRLGRKLHNRDMRKTFRGENTKRNQLLRNRNANNDAFICDFVESAGAQRSV